MARGSKKRKRKLLIAIVVIVLIAAIALGVLYAVRPDIFDAIVSMFVPEKPDETEKPDVPTLPDNTTVTGDILSVRVLDIGQGDCIYIEFPDGQNMIMDIGSEFGSTSPWNVINGVLVEEEVEQIDYLFITHGDYDHIRDAKKLLDNYEVVNIYMPLDEAQDSTTWRNLLTAADEETYTDASGVEKPSVYHENIGAFAIEGENWVMNCYTFDEADYPECDDAEPINAVSPICLLEYAGRTIVLTGDSNELNEEYLLAKGYFDDVDAACSKSRTTARGRRRRRRFWTRSTPSSRSSRPAAPRSSRTRATSTPIPNSWRGCATMKTSRRTATMTASATSTSLPRWAR